MGKILNPDDNTFNTTVIVLVIDSEKEAEVGIGRDWNKRPLGYEEVYVSNSALRQIQVQPNKGERLHLGIDFVGLIKSMGVNIFLFTLFYITQILPRKIKNNLKQITKKGNRSKYGH